MSEFNARNGTLLSAIPEAAALPVLSPRQQDAVCTLRRKFAECLPVELHGGNFAAFLAYCRSLDADALAHERRQTRDRASSQILGDRMQLASEVQALLARSPCKQQKKVAQPPRSVDAMLQDGADDLLMREEEVALGEEMIRRRNHWRESVLAQPFAQRAALECHEGYLQQTSRKNRYLFKPVDGEYPAPAAIEEYLPRLEAAVQRLESARRARLSTAVQSGTWESGADADLVRDAIACFEEHPIEDRVLLGIQERMEWWLEVMERERDSWANPGSSEILTDAMDEALTWPSDFQSAMATMHSAREAWRETRGIFVEKNHRLVRSVAYKWNSGVSKADLLRYGNQGLLRAVDKWEPQRGFKFATYATWWIRQAISRGSWEAKLMAVPVHMSSVLEAIRQYHMAYAEQNGGALPSLLETAEHCGITLEAAEGCMRARRPRSIDAPFGEEYEDDLKQLLADKREGGVMRNLASAELRDALMEALRSLPPRESEIIIYKYGLGLRMLPRRRGQRVGFEFDQASYGRCHTLDETGNHFHVTRERIRQIEAKVLAKLGNTDHPLRQAMAAMNHEEAQKKGEAPTPFRRTESFDASDDDPHASLALSEVIDSVRIVNVLEREGIYTVGDYLALSDADKDALWLMGEGGEAAIEAAINSLPVSHCQNLSPA
ncbi:MAG: RNA polymerase primary sigma factor [Candidatus Peregrinibacteria bacterium Gr01-1014_25]|nr:MAG: RNA polymerase primary sigma factor [Candidatus Peregrinibacteria bacterium Gr01-1014_25]